MMVRLQQTLRNFPPRHTLSFNSMMVRLQPPDDIYTLLLQNKFQFNDGTITTRTLSLVSTARRSFNSMMVRLQLKKAFRSSLFVPRFNSMMVRLQPFTTEAPTMSNQGFNSMMVRLQP